MFFAEAEEFCARISRVTGLGFRLPSEAEWEYACRAGTRTRYHFGEAISQEVANYNDGFTRPLGLTPVGSKNAPNRYGLHDMHGSVAEWCADLEHLDYVGAPTNSLPWMNGGAAHARMQRGGSYLFSADSARSDARRGAAEMFSASGYGFRVAIDWFDGAYDQQVFSNGLADSAQYTSGPIAPGMIVSLFGKNLGPWVSAQFVLTESGRIATELAGVRVICNGEPAPILFASSGQINFVVPYSVEGMDSLEVILERDSQTSTPLMAPIVPAAPAIFTMGGSGVGQAAAINANGAINSVQSPALRGSTVALYVTGLGQTNPPSQTGGIAPGPGFTPALPLGVRVGGQQAQIQYVGAAPGLVFGISQVNVLIPDNVSPGSVPIRMSMGGHINGEGVTICVA